MNYQKIVFVVIFLILNNPFQIFAQIQFEPHIIISEKYDALGAYQVYAVDLDGDNDMDVISSSNFNMKIAWYENDGSEHFKTHIITDSANIVYAVDVDSDGDIDVISDYSGYYIAWHENDGNGIFSTHTIPANDDICNSIFAADVDGDGDMDLLAAFRNTDEIAWYENNGNEDFSIHIITSTAGPAYSVYAIDVDGDNDIDVLSASSGYFPTYPSKIAWYENDGDENFNSHTITDSAFGAYSVFAIDVDDDGDLDILSSSRHDNKINWYENNGSQNFINHTITDSAIFAYSVYATDMDNDGDIDVLSASFSDNKIAWYENDGNGNFNIQIITTEAYGATSVYAVDVNDDGAIDVLSASWNDSKISWYENDGFQNFNENTITTALFGARCVFATDMDCDGDIDILSASSGLSNPNPWGPWFPGKIIWYENDDNENFYIHTITTGVQGASSVYATDVDGDSDIDVLSASTYGVPFAPSINKIAWYENGGNENFNSHTITDSAVGANSVFAIDVDGDGDMDVLSASYLDDKIAWYENDGNENFTSNTITTSADGAISVFAADVNGDGDMDVLSASYLDDKIAWYENDGNENFIAHTITINALAAQSVFAIDLDNDGDIDILSASASDNKVAWYENDGNENFNTHIISINTFNANSVYAEDVDGDGDLDVLSSSLGYDPTYPSKIAWYENDGNENFDAHIISTDALGAQSVYAIDVDGDNDIDVLSASEDDRKIAWYENLGPTYIENEDIVKLPNEFNLNQNFPNPFNPNTTVEFSIPKSELVTLKIYNLLGQEVEELVAKRLTPGNYKYNWDASSFASGVYFYKLETSNLVLTKKLILLR